MQCEGRGRKQGYASKKLEMAEKLVRNTSTEELRRWRDAVEKIAAAPPAPDAARELARIRPKGGLS